MGAALQKAHLTAVGIGAILVRLIESVYDVTDDSEGESAQTLVRLPQRYRANMTFMVKKVIASCRRSRT